MKHSTTKLKVLTCCIMAYLMPTQVVQSSDTIKSIKEVFVNLSLENASVKEAFSQLEDLTQFKFHYSKSSIDNKVRFKKNYEHASVAQILTDIGKGARLAFRQVNRTISVRKVKNTQKADITIEIEQTDVTVTGTVTDENGEPLVGASVVIKGTSKGTITDTEGKYTINVPDDAVLVVSFLGYADQEVMVSGRSIVDVQMVVDVQSLDEVVVVGYGAKAKKRDLTGSVSSVGAKDLAYTQNHSVDQRLSGMMAGVQVISSGGKPGAGARINIRGVTAIRGSNQPLYVVDGTPIVVAPNFGIDPNTIAGTEGVRENPLLGINPDDIERIDVLKDASAAALYGARAANGVILITTKQGKENARPEINFSITTAIQNPTNKYQPLDANQYRIYMKRLKPDVKDSYFGNANTNWQDLILNKNALMTKYNMSVSGGAEKMRYYLSGSATNQQGAMTHNRLKRYTVRASIDAEVLTKLTIGTSINYNYSINKGTAADWSESAHAVMLKALDFRPDYPVYDKNGNYTAIYRKVESEDGSGKTILVEMKRNPVGDRENSWENRILNNLIGNVYAEYEIINNLKFKTSVNIGIYNSATASFHPKHSKFAHSPEEGLYRWSLLTHDNSKSHSTTWANTLRYEKSWGNIHHVDGLLGVSWDRYRMDVTQNKYAGFPDDKKLIDVKSATKALPPKSQTTLDGLNSIFARVNYTYRGRYLLTLTVRRDGSTKFGPNNKYGTFPSGALAWNINQEKFMSGIRKISYLKLRASIGKTGSDNLPSFTYVNSVSTLSGKLWSAYDDKNGIVPLARPNPNIRWEETLQTDAGLEVGFFDHRLNAEIVYFNKNTSGIILDTSLPPQFGFDNQQVNYGKVRNWGWEIVLGGDIIKDRHFRWNSSLNISFIKNLVVDLDKTLPNWSESISEGQSVGDLFGDPIERIAQTQKEIDELDRKAPGGKYDEHLNQPGDYIRKDTDGDGRYIDSKDMIFLGKMSPDYYGGWINRLSYKGIEFSFLFQFVQGVSKHWRLQETLLDGNNFGYGINPTNTTTIALNAWAPDNRNAYYARPGYTARSDTNQRNVYDASFIRLRSIQLGYTLPQQWINKTPFSSVRLGIGASNLLTITKYPGLDPETGSLGRSTRATGDVSDLSADVGTEYPMNRTYFVNINVTF